MADRDPGVRDQRLSDLQVRLPALGMVSLGAVELQTQDRPGGSGITKQAIEEPTVAEFNDRGKYPTVHFRVKAWVHADGKVKIVGDDPDLPGNGMFITVRSGTDTEANIKQMISSQHMFSEFVKAARTVPEGVRQIREMLQRLRGEL